METTTFPSVCADVAPPPRLALPPPSCASSGAVVDAIPGAAGGHKTGTHRTGGGSRRGDGEVSFRVAKLDFGLVPGSGAPGDWLGWGVKEEGEEGSAASETRSRRRRGGEVWCLSGLVGAWNPAPARFTSPFLFFSLFYFIVSFLFFTCTCILFSRHSSSSYLYQE